MTDFIGSLFDSNAIFLVTWLLVALLLLNSPRAVGPLQLLTSFFNRRGLSGKSHPMLFPALRFGLGLTMAVREGVVLMLLESSAPRSALISSGIALGLALFVMVGLLTQYAVLAQMFLVWMHLERFALTSTLGTDVAAMLCAFLFLTQAGRTLSLDSVLLQRMPQLQPALLYRKRVHPADVTLARFIALFSFGAISLYSLFQHLGESAWVGGTVGTLLLSDNFMSRLGAQFEYLFTAFPLLIFVMKVAIYIQMIWFASIIFFPFISRVTRAFTEYWGWAFFILSALVLQLGFLGPIEMLLWIAIFSGFSYQKSATGHPSETHPPARFPESSPIVNIWVGHTLLAVLVFLLSLPTPFLSRNTSLFPPDAGKIAENYGVQPIGVFNQDDLKMRENWFTVRSGKDFDYTLPILDETHTRGPLHLSDRVYFGSTLRFSRSMIGSEGCGLDEHLDRIVIGIGAWERLLGSSLQDSEYLITQYRQPSPDLAKLSQGDYVRGEISIICSILYQR